MVIYTIYHISYICAITNLIFSRARFYSLFDAASHVYRFKQMRTIKF